MGSNNKVKAELLAARYVRNGDKPVAFVDESYRSKEQQRNAAPFYIATAVVIAPEEHEIMRKQLIEVAEAEYWHSTQAFQSEEGKAKFMALIDYVVDGVEPIVIAVQSEVDEKDSNLEEARLDCITALACELTSGAVHEPVELIVVEERHDQASRKRDEYIFSQARKQNLIPRTTAAFQASPSYEKLLWLPDVISYALYRNMAENEPEMYNAVSNRVRTIDVPSGRQVQPQKDA
ncbi:hypothetical protein [Pseudarthrobacter sp. lyk4-40-TYG-27]|uniref:hypothetical protein n=1 Tax=Pseudarthrobacter sp. lyk4-40-TYG-27 TaxID=3040305 RepID=UPI0025545A09|nr:hypothetical protein [Pseudarthrobacter sp. lyk4-40-TYG-27]